MTTDPLVLLASFWTEPFLQRALLGGLCLALAAAPLGVFLVMRRMSLIVDAVGHAILPGASTAAALGTSSTLALSAGAAATGAGVFALAGSVSRLLRLPEDAGFAVFYLGALSLGVVLASGTGGVDLERLLFGAILALDDAALWLCALAVPVSWLGLAALYRALLYDTADPALLSPQAAARVRAAFFALLAVVTVASFHALGAMMAVGLAVLPAIAARHLAAGVPGRIVAAMIVGSGGVVLGLAASLLLDAAAGAAIVLVLTGLVLLSALAGPQDSVLSRRRPFAKEVSGAGA
jgi:zinc/manganese transport system permease protein